MDFVRTASRVRIHLVFFAMAVCSLCVAGDSAPELRLEWNVSSNFDKGPFSGTYQIGLLVKSEREEVGTLVFVKPLVYSAKTVKGVYEIEVTVDEKAIANPGYDPAQTGDVTGIRGGGLSTLIDHSKMTVEEKRACALYNLPKSGTVRLTYVISPEVGKKFSVWSGKVSSPIIEVKDGVLFRKANPKKK